MKLQCFRLAFQLCFSQCMLLLLPTRQNAQLFIFFLIRNVYYMSRIYALNRKKPLHDITEFLSTEISHLPLKHLLLATIGYQYGLMISLIPRDIFSL